MLKNVLQSSQRIRNDKNYEFHFPYFKFLHFFTPFFNWLTYWKENSFEKHSDTKNLREKCSTYYNIRCGIIIMLHRAREIRVERAKTKRSCRIRKEGEHCWNHSNLWNCNFSHEFHRTRSNLSRNAAKETNPFPYSLGFSFYWQS